MAIVKKGTTESLYQEGEINQDGCWTKLTNTHLEIGDGVQKSPVVTINLHDVVGTTLSEQGKECVLHVHTYVKVPPRLLCCADPLAKPANYSRSYKEHRFLASPKAANFFQLAIRNILVTGSFTTTTNEASQNDDTTVTKDDDNSNHEPSKLNEMPKRRIFVLINPVGGQGLGPTIFEERIKPVLDLAWVDYEVYQTKCAGDATEVAKTLPLRFTHQFGRSSETSNHTRSSEGHAKQSEINDDDSGKHEMKENDHEKKKDNHNDSSDLSETKNMDKDSWDMLMVVGGDGLAHEFIQGLMARPDSEQAIKFPFMLIPAGSGNGLSKSLLYASDEAFSFESAAFLAVKGYPIPLDLAEVRSGGNEETYFAKKEDTNPSEKMKTRYCILGIAWGVVADVDIESETVRWMGALRFTIGGLLAICKFQGYEATFCYRPPGIGSLKGKMSSSSIEDDSTDISGQAKDSSSDAIMVSHSSLNNQNQNDVDGWGLSLDELIKNGWRSMAFDDWFMWWALTISHGAHDMHACPGAKFDDGLFHVLYGPKHATDRCDSLCTFLAMEEGTHLNKNSHSSGVKSSKNPVTEGLDEDSSSQALVEKQSIQKGVQVLQCEAFRLCIQKQNAKEAVKTKDSILTADGEVIEPYGDVHACILQGKARVIAFPSMP
eukprot:g1578.t1